MDSTSKASEASAAPWAILKSSTVGRPSLILSKSNTDIGEICDFVDMETGERAQEYRNAYLV